MTNGSYPSGHSSLGWAWALILSEIDPEHANAILARGRAFGESRVICGVHWQSDVEEGRFMGASAVARLHADPAFRADLEAARAELAGIRAKNLKPTRDCRAEAAAMAGATAAQAIAIGFLPPMGLAVGLASTMTSLPSYPVILIEPNIRSAWMRAGLPGLLRGTTMRSGARVSAPTTAAAASKAASPMSRRTVLVME